MRNAFTVGILFLLAAVLILSAGLARAVSPDTVQYLPGDDQAGPAAFNQEEPDIAAGGNQYLVVWTDYRTGGNPLIIDEGGADILAARLDAAGNLIDTIPIAISQDAGDQTDPQVAWNGTNWLVAWESMTPTEFYWSSEIQGIRVSPAGVVLDPSPITIYKYPSSTDSDFALASDGSNWAVVVRGTSAGESELLGIRIGPDGIVLDPDGVVIVDGTTTLSFNLQVAFAVDEYLVTFLQSGILQGIRLETDLQKKDPTPFTISSSSGLQDPRLASNGTGFFQIWRNYSSTTQWGEARGTRISYEGQVLDPGGLEISGLIFIGAVDPRVSWDGTRWVTSFKEIHIGTSDPDTTYGARVSVDGVVLDPGGVPIEPVATRFAEIEMVEAVGGGAQVIWKDDRAGGGYPYDVSTYKLNTDLTPGAPAVVSFGSPAQTGAALADSGSGYMVAYISRVSGSNRIMAHPLDVNGAPMLQEPVQLGETPNLVNVSVAWDGSMYFVTWAEVGTSTLNDSMVYGRRIQQDGTPVDPAPVVLMEGFSVDVAALNGVFLVVAIQQTISPEFLEPMGVRVDGATGTILDGSPIDLGASFAGAPSVSPLSNGWIVTYQRNFSHDDPNAEIRATVVESTGSVANAFTVSTGLGSFLYDPDVAFDGTNAIVVWHNAGSDDINGARVDGNGVNISAFIVSGAQEDQDAPAVAWDGARYVTLYQDLRNVTFFIDERSDIFGTRLSAEGQVLDQDGISLYSDVLSEINPAATGSNGLALLAAGVYLPDEGAYRIGYQFLGDNIPPTPTPTPVPIFRIYLPLLSR